MKTVSLFTPCFNEEGNIETLYEAVRKVMDSMPQYRFEYVLIDNASTDRTVEILREICAKDPRVKVIVNRKNFGPGRSGCYGFLQTSGDVAICFAADLQDPPEMIPEFLKKWENGAKVVWGRKDGDEEKGLIRFFRKAYYTMIRIFSDEKQYSNVSGFGLYDREVIELIREVDDPIPNFRHLIADFGYEVEFVDYVKPNRKKGRSSYNFWRYYNTAMDSLVSTSTTPLRIVMLLGFIFAFLSFLIGVIYLILKLIFWYTFSAGQAPILIGMFFLGAVQIFFVGLLGEYVGSIVTRVKKRPMVVEKERINFPAADKAAKEEEEA